MIFRRGSVVIVAVVVVSVLPSPVFPTEKEEEVDESGGHREMMQVLGNTLTAMLNKYWIYICAGMFFFVSFQGRIVMYKIIYMMLLLFCVACYQVLLLWAYCTLRSGWLCADF